MKGSECSGLSVWYLPPPPSRGKNMVVRGAHLVSDDPSSSVGPLAMSSALSFPWMSEWPRH